MSRPLVDRCRRWCRTHAQVYEHFLPVHFPRRHCFRACSSWLRPHEMPSGVHAFAVVLSTGACRPTGGLATGTTKLPALHLSVSLSSSASSLTRLSVASALRTLSVACAAPRLSCATCASSRLQAVRPSQIQARLQSFLSTLTQARLGPGDEDATFDQGAASTLYHFAFPIPTVIPTHALVRRTMACASSMPSVKGASDFVACQSSAAVLAACTACMPSKPSGRGADNK